MVFSAKAKAAKAMTRRSIVEKRDEEGLAAPAPITDLGAVHDVAHPQLPGIAEGESSPVGRGGLAGTPVEQALAREQPVHRGGSKTVVDAARAGGLDELVDRHRGVLGLELDEALCDLGGQAPGLAAVGAALRVQRLEPAGAIHTQPIAHRLRGDPGAPGAGDGVGALGPLA